jgi:hypothetical protein
MRTSSGQLSRWIGLIAGFCLAAVIVYAGRLPAEGRVAGAEVTMRTQPPAALAVDPAGVPFLHVRDLRPGASERATLRIRNLLARPVRVTVRARSTSRDLDRALHVELRVAGRHRFSGTLGDLRASSSAFPLAAFERAVVALRVASRPGAAGRSADVELTWRAREVAS